MFYLYNSIIISILAASVYYVLFNSVDKGLCSEQEKPPNNLELASKLQELSLLDQLECYFSEDYFQAREQFRKLATLANAEQKSLPVVDSLTTDVAIFRGNTEKYLIHISGTHGVEAYSGSAIQAAILDHLRVTKFYEGNNHTMKLPTLILVHALNPFGFANNRRVNEENIDLNRNFLHPNEFEFVIARDPNYAGYVDMDPLLNPTTKYSSNYLINELLSFSQLGYVSMAYGIKKIKRALVSGNYNKQQGLGFGGFQQAQSTKHLIQLLTKEFPIPNVAKNVVLLDVHTGLGPRGVDTCIYDTSASISNTIMEILFPTEYDQSGKLLGGIKIAEFKSSPLQQQEEKDEKSSTKPHSTATDVAAGYELTVGTISTSFCNNFLAPNREGLEHICITQVF
jgi:hypothetical protein